MKKADSASAIESPFEHLLGQTLSYVSYRPRSEKEIVSYCEKRTKGREIDEDVIPRVCLRLKELGLFDDRKFSQWFVEGRLRGKPVGKTRIRLELLRFGVTPDIADEALRGSEMVDSEAERDRAKKAAQKKLAGLVGLPKLKQKARLYSFLRGRGFDSNSVSRVVDEVVGEAVQ